LLENSNAGVLRFAQDDSIGAFFRTLLSPRARLVQTIADGEGQGGQGRGYFRRIFIRDEPNKVRSLAKRQAALGVAAGVAKRERLAPFRRFGIVDLPRTYSRW
jgi:hypothetical protein